MLNHAVIPADISLFWCLDPFLTWMILKPGNTNNATFKISRSNLHVCPFASSCKGRGETPDCHFQADLWWQSVFCTQQIINFKQIEIHKFDPLCYTYSTTLQGQLFYLFSPFFNCDKKNTLSCEEDEGIFLKGFILVI